MLRLSCAANVATFHVTREAYFGYLYAKPLLKRFMSKLHRKVAVSLTARDFVRQYFPGDYSIIPNGIDIAAYTRPGSPSRSCRTGRSTSSSWGAWTSGRA